MAEQTKDNLASLLVLVSAHYKLKTNVNQLTAGLPLVNGKLTPELFVRAAERVGLFVKLASRNLESVSSLLLPAVVNLKNEDSLILAKIDREKKYN